MEDKQLPSTEGEHRVVEAPARLVLVEDGCGGEQLAVPASASLEIGHGYSEGVTGGKSGTAASSLTVAVQTLMTLLPLRSARSSANPPTTMAASYVRFKPTPCSTGTRPRPWTTIPCQVHEHQARLIAHQPDSRCQRTPPPGGLCWRNLRPATPTEITTSPASASRSARCRGVPRRLHAAEPRHDRSRRGSDAGARVGSTRRTSQARKAKLHTTVAQATRWHRQLRVSLCGWRAFPAAAVWIRAPTADAVWSRGWQSLPLPGWVSRAQRHRSSGS